MRINIPIILSIIFWPSIAISGGLDSTGQSINTFLQSKNYAELNIISVSPDVSGKDYLGNDIPNIGETRTLATGGVKFQLNDKFSLGLLYDQPFGAKAKYEGNSLFTVTDSNGIISASETKVSSHNLTTLLSYSPKTNFKIFGGIAYQEMNASLQLRGAAYGPLSGYNLNFDSGSGHGWIGGFAYELPKIALKTSLTYRSKISHDLETHESSNIDNFENLNSTTKFTTPQSINFDFQTGISQNTLLFGNVRWSNWTNFIVSPEMYQSITHKELVLYQKNPISANIGLGRKLSDKISTSVSLGWDSGSGDGTSLQPINGYKNIGLGFLFKPNDKINITSGFKYFWVGDSNNSISEFKNNNALAFALKFGYYF